MPPATSTRLLLVRHGENFANLTKQFSHRLIDLDLTSRGILQSQQTADALLVYGVDAIFASPLRRATQTAQIISTRLGLPVTIIEDLREANIGDLEKEPPSAETWALHNTIVDSWFQGQPENAFPGGEDHHELTGRFLNALIQVMNGRDGQTLLVVGHGGMFSWALPALCPQVDLRWLREQTTHNCALSEIHARLVDGRVEGKLISWASHQHLSGEAANFASPVATDDDFARTG